MSTVLILGGGPIGLASAILFARDGHDVTVLEKDPQVPPGSGLEAWQTWDRPGVAQFRQVHALHARFRQLLEAEFPEVRDELDANGGRHTSIMNLPSTIEDRSPRPDDDRFRTISARRPVVEAAFSRVAENTPGVRVIRGVAVEGLLARANGIPHVTGVRTKDGKQLVADLIVDAMGRRSKFVDWVTEIGARPPLEEATETGFAYYTRHYRARTGTGPELNGLPFSNLDSFLVVTLPSDNNTWAIAIVCMAGDMPLKEIRHNDVFERVARSVPRVEPWLEGEPLHDVYPMAGAMDRYRRFVVDGSPVVTGMVAIGDSWACTNPTAGRGLSLGIGQAVALRDIARERFDDPTGLAMALDDVTEQRFTPWFRQQMDRDRARVAEVKAAIEGREPPKPDESDPMARVQRAFLVAANYDPDVARAFLEVLSVLTLPQEIMRRPGMLETVMAASEDRELPPTAGPKRAELLALIGS